MKRYSDNKIINILVWLSQFKLSTKIKYFDGLYEFANSIFERNESKNGAIANQTVKLQSLLTVEIYTFSEMEEVFSKLNKLKKHVRDKNMFIRYNKEDELEKLQKKLQLQLGGWAGINLLGFDIKLPKSKYFSYYRIELEACPPDAFKIFYTFVPSQEFQYEYWQLANGNVISPLRFAKGNIWQKISVFNRPIYIFSGVEVKKQKLKIIIETAGKEIQKYIIKNLPGIFSRTECALPILEKITDYDLNFVLEKVKEKRGMKRIGVINPTYYEAFLKNNNSQFEQFFNPDRKALFISPLPSSVKSFPVYLRLAIEQGNVTTDRLMLWAITGYLYLYIVLRKLRKISNSLDYNISNKASNSIKYSTLSKMQSEVDMIQSTVKMIFAGWEYDKKSFISYKNEYTYKVAINAQNGDKTHTFDYFDGMVNRYEYVRKDIRREITIIQRRLEQITNQILAKSNRNLQYSILALTVAATIITVLQFLSNKTLITDDNKKEITTEELNFSEELK